MTKHPDDPHESQLIDRLVDGELQTDERHLLLAQLEHEPDGWRRCALAFLEAQTWQSEFRTLLSPPSKVQNALSQQPANNPRGPRTWLTGVWGTCLAMAASFLLAFWLGNSWTSQPRVTNTSSPGNASLANSATAEKEAIATTAVPDKAPTHASPSRVTLVVNDGSARPGSRVELPVVEATGTESLRLLNQPTVLPDEFRRVLEQLGNQVHIERQFVPFELNDGRRGIVPVDAVEVVPVSTVKFQ